MSHSLVPAPMRRVLLAGSALLPSVLPLLVLSAASASMLAKAAVVQLDSAQVHVAFDPDSFSLIKDEHSFGAITQVNVPGGSLSYTLVGQDAIRMDLGGTLGVFASSYGNFSSETLGGSFNLAFQFTPQAGFMITGYTVTLEALASIETPGSVYLGADAGGQSGQTSSAGATTLTLNTTGAIAPSIQGSFGATGDVTTVQVFDGYDTYLDHYETVLDHCETEDPFNCYYREEPVYVTQPRYHDETDLGEASMQLQAITVQAHVVAVPELDARWLAMLAMPPVVAWARRQRRA
ncbi:MAG: hypothetical protein QM742_20055 [Aquabacterium sp.]